MRQFKLILFALSILAAPELFAKEGWINLFNGKDLSGWTQKTGDARFFVDDGCIVGEVVSESDTNSVLCTKKNYDNFILELDFKVDHQLFSGVHIRSEYAAKDTPGKWNGQPLTIPAGHVYGYLVLIDPSPIHRWWTATLYDQRWWTAGIYDEWRRMWLYPGSLGGDPDKFSRQGMKIFNTNDWNHLRIEAVGDSIKTYLNGVLCAHIKDSLTPKGFIGLQVRDWISDDDHETLPGAKVRFRNIRLKPVSPKPPMAGPPPNTLAEIPLTRGAK
jgi:3-keto-disaccharide hydrolase